MPERTDPGIDRTTLLLAQLDGTLNDAGRSRVAALLRDDADAADELVWLAVQRTLLAERCAAAATARAIDHVIDDRRPTGRAVTLRRRFALAAVIAVAAGSLALVASALRPDHSGADEAAPSPIAAADDATGDTPPNPAPGRIDLTTAIFKGDPSAPDHDPATPAIDPVGPLLAMGPARIELSAALDPYTDHASLAVASPDWPIRTKPLESSLDPGPAPAPAAIQLNPFNPRKPPEPPETPGISPVTPGNPR